jgi:hypothetical protein
MRTCSLKIRVIHVNYYGGDCQAGHNLQDFNKLLRGVLETLLCTGLCLDKVKRGSYSNGQAVDSFSKKNNFGCKRKR